MIVLPLQEEKNTHHKKQKLSRKQTLRKRSTVFVRSVREKLGNIYGKRATKIALAYGITIAVFGSVFIFAKISPKTLGSNEPINSATPMVLGASTIAARGEDTPVAPPPQPQEIVAPDTSDVLSRNFLVYDAATGAHLLEKNVDEQVSIASITKLVTALVVYDQMNFDYVATITPVDRLNVSPSLGLRPNDHIKIGDLFNAMLVGSNNDAALALANITERATGKNFVKLMNDKAQSLGMVNSHFSNPLGFDSSGNYSTANDLQLLVSETRKYAVFTELGRKENYSFISEDGLPYSTMATNRLLKNHPDIEAVKTGLTRDAGEAMITKATQNGHSVYIVVLTSNDREGDTIKLKDLVFSSFAWKSDAAQ